MQSVNDYRGGSGGVDFVSMHGIFPAEIQRRSSTRPEGSLIVSGLPIKTHISLRLSELNLSLLFRVFCKRRNGYNLKASGFLYTFFSHHNG